MGRRTGCWTSLLLLTAACGTTSVSPIVSPSPTATASHGRDAALDLLAACRPDACSVSGSVDRADGTRVVVIEALPDLGDAQVLLVRGDRLVDSYVLRSQYSSGVRTDSTGHLLVIANGNTATDVVPLAVESDRLVPVPLRGSNQGMYGDNNYSFVDNGGVLDVVVGQHTMRDQGVATATVTWHWDGTAYVEGPCTGDREPAPEGLVCQARIMLVRTPDGRDLDVLDTGGGGLPVIYHAGTPGGLVAFPPTIEAARAVGLRWISYARPGYAGSTPHPGRAVGDAAADTATVLDALGLTDFVTYGWSGGGPHALACAALLPPRCRGAALVASVAPWDAQGLDFLAGMGSDNLEEFGLAVEGRAALAPFLTDAAAGMVDVTAEGVVASLGDLVPAVDVNALTGDVAEWVAGSFRSAVSGGSDGWLDDDLAFVAAWGFAAEEVTVPTAVWQGGQDLMVPLEHGRWLASRIPGARQHLLPDHGHISLVRDVIPAVLADLAAHS